MTAATVLTIAALIGPGLLLLMAALAGLAATWHDRTQARAEMRGRRESTTDAATRAHMRGLTLDQYLYQRTPEEDA